MNAQQQIDFLTLAIGNLQRRIDQLERSLEEGDRAAALDDQLHWEAIQRRQDEAEMMAEF